MTQIARTFNWWHSLQEISRLDIWKKYKPNSLHEDWGAWWYCLNDTGKIKVYKENKDLYTLGVFIK